MVGPSTNRSGVEEAVGLVGRLGDFQHHRMPNGTEVFYRDSDHSYFTEIKPKTKGRGENKVIVGYSGVRAAQIGSPSAIGGHAESGVPEPLADWFARQGPNWREKRDRKGTVGTLVHKAVEDRWRDGVRTDPEQAPEDARGYLRGVDLMFRDHRFVAPLLETVVYSRKYKYAGRFDAGLRWAGSVSDPHQDLSADPLFWEPGDSILADAKTSSFIARAYHHQLQLYEIASEECGYGFWDHLAIFQFCDDGTYRILPARSTRLGAESCVYLYEMGKETDRLAREDYKAVTA